MRKALMTAAVVLTATACAAPRTPPATSPDLVTTGAGDLRGTVTDTHRRFEGIPYAAPPVGELRWRAPQPVAPWSGVRAATEPGSLCPQQGTAYADTGSTDEDCLFLNVTAPREGTGKPVIVWLHGDGAIGGGSMFDPRALVDTGDVVVVTINYRLGVFGGFGFPGLADSGTFGLLDQQAALRWVRENIGAFGGDPANVTVMGQSYGAQSVSAHLIAPGSAGLFDRAIMQSPMTLLDMPAGSLLAGLPAAPWFAWREATEVERLGADSVTRLGCADLACLRALPVESLFPLTQVFQPMAFGGPALPSAPDAAFERGEFHRVPVLVGTTRDEHRGFVGLFFDLAGTPVTEAQYPELLAAAFGDRAAEVADRYPPADYPSPSVAWAEVLTDRMWARDTARLTAALARHTPVHVYEFADRQAPSYLPFPDTFPTGAYHAADVPYLFRDEEFERDSTPEQRVLSDRMLAYWTNFARGGDPNGGDPNGGDPNGGGLPRWDEHGAGGVVQSLAPDRIGPVDFAAEHRLDFWRG